MELVVEASAQLLALSDLGVNRDEARSRVDQVIADGSALAAYERWIATQGSGRANLEAAAAALTEARGV